MTRINDATFVCIDCETTGLDIQNDRIIEVAVASFSLDEIHHSFESLIDPQRSIPDDAIKIHNITQDMVQGKPTIDKVLPEILRIVSNHIIIGHGVAFDIGLVALAADRLGIPHTLRNNKVLDTLRMARLYGQSPTNSLEQLRSHFNIQAEGAHRAMNDVVVNREVFKQLSKDYRSLEDLFDQLSRPIALKNMPLGKHKGRPMREVPLPYLLWSAKQDFDQDLLYTIRSEINRRKKGETFTQSSNPFSNL